jgi:hypothetical protein
VTQVLGVSTSYVDAKVKSGRYRAVRDGDMVLIDIDSVFGDLERLPAVEPKPAKAVSAPSPQQPERKKRGRPRKRSLAQDAPSAGGDEKGAQS